MKGSIGEGWVLMDRNVGTAKRLRRWEGLSLKPICSRLPLHLITLVCRHSQQHHAVQFIVGCDPARQRAHTVKSRFGLLLERGAACCGGSALFILLLHDILLYFRRCAFARTSTRSAGRYTLGPTPFCCSPCALPCGSPEALAAWAQRAPFGATSSTHIGCCGELLGSQASDHDDNRCAGCKYPPTVESPTS